MRLGRVDAQGERLADQHRSVLGNGGEVPEPGRVVRRTRRGAAPGRCATARGWRARRRPGATGCSVAMRWKALAEATRNSPPQALPSVAVAGAVEGDADDRTVEAVLGDRAGHVRVVVLHGHLHRLGPVERVPRRGVVRVQVVGDHLGPAAEEPLHPVDRLLVGPVDLELVEVAHVGPEHRDVARRRGRTCSSAARRRPAPGGPPGGRAGSGRGTKPRERRSSTGAPATTRATESSHRVTMGRSWVRKRSAMSRSLTSASGSWKTIGSSE